MHVRIPWTLEKTPVDSAMLEKDARLHAPDHPEIPLPRRRERCVERVTDENQDGDDIEPVGFEVPSAECRVPREKQSEEWQ